MLSSIGVVTDVWFWGGLLLERLETAEALLLPLDPLLEPCELGEWGLREAMLGCRLGPLMLLLEPLLSPCRSLLSRSKDTFISLGLGVLKMVRFSRHLALLNSRRTTQIVMNIRNMATRIPIMAGSTYFPG